MNAGILQQWVAIPLAQQDRNIFSLNKSQGKIKIQCI